MLRFYHLSWSLPALLAVLVLVVFSTTAADAEPHFDQGVKYYQAGNYKAANENFARIGGADSQPTVLYYQALCNQQMGNNTAALQLYKKINNNFPNSQEAKLSQQYLARLAGRSAVVGNGAARSAGHSNGTSAGGLGSRDRLPDSSGVSFHRGPGNHMLVNAEVGGRMMEVMFDTGAEQSYFGRNQLINAGCKFYPTGEKTSSYGVGGKVDVDICACEVRLGDIVRTIPIMVSAQNTDIPLLGQSFFNPFRYDIDTSAGIIHFQRKGAHSNEGFDTMNVPFTPKGNELEVICSIDGHDCKAYFDTGAGCSMFSLAVLQNMGISVPRDAEPLMLSGVGGGGIAYRFRVNRLSLGPVQKSPMEIVASPSCAFCLIGQDFFKDKRFSIDNENRVIKFVR
jgi:predicted aspartyl protease